MTRDGPRLIFPPDGASVMAPGFGPGSRGLVLAAGGGDISWYVDGAPIGLDAASGRPVWRPAGAGFYLIAAVDRQGRRALARVRVLASPRP